MTEKQKQALRLCHHEFNGFTTKKAAEKMGCSVQTINKLLREAKKIAPSMFPILTKQQYRTYLLLQKGYNRQEIAERFNKDLKFVDNIIQQLRKKAYYRPISCKPTHYEPWMDGDVKEKF